ncbi:MAG: CRTAC1 family protein, partial [Bacteroidota bacterium]
PCQYFRNSNWQFNDVSQELSLIYGPNIWSWGLAAGDPDRNGYLDLYLANYGWPSAKNAMLWNNGNGTFWNDQNTNLIEYTKTSFQPTWVDLNNDLWPDLHIINDRSFRNDYYEQTTPGVFQDKSVETGLGISIDAMSNSMADYDLDGDFDFYITNINGNKLLQNNNLIFSNVANLVGAELMQWSWSGLWIDLENNGWNDLFVATEHLTFEYPQHHKLFRNNLGILESATDDELTTLAFGSFSSAKGDFNQDGKYDILLGAENSQFFNVFENTITTENDFIKFKLEGRCSNRNAFGTRYEIYANGEEYVGYTQSSDNYISQNSQNIIQGLSNAVKVDSINIHWSSGIVDHYENLEVNQSYVFVEAFNKDRIQCEMPTVCLASDSVLLSVPEYWNEVTWFDSDTSHQKWVVGPGNYYAYVGTGYGKEILVSQEIALDTLPAFQQTLQNPSCWGESDGSIELVASSDQTVLWSETNLPAGEYIAAFLFGEAGCVHRDTLYLENPNELVVASISASNPLCFEGDEGEISIAWEGGTAPYFLNGDSSNTISSPIQWQQLSSGNYAIGLTDANGCILDTAVTLVQPSLLLVNLNYSGAICLNTSTPISFEIEGGTPPYNFPNPDTTFFAGAHDLVFTDANGCSVSEQVVISNLPQTQWSYVSVQPSILNGGEIEILPENCTNCTIHWQTGDSTWLITGLSEGSYAFTISDNWGCEVGGEVNLIFNSVDFENQTNSFWHFSQEGFENSSSIVQRNVLCFDSTGKLVGQANTVGSREVLHVPGMSTGIYFIHSQNGKFKVAVYELK